MPSRETREIIRRARQFAGIRPTEEDTRRAIDRVRVALETELLCKLIAQAGPPTVAVYWQAATQSPETMDALVSCHAARFWWSMWTHQQARKLTGPDSVAQVP